MKNSAGRGREKVAEARWKRSDFKLAILLSTHKPENTSVRVRGAE